MTEFPDAATLMAQSLQEARPGPALAGATAMAALLSALARHPKATRFYLGCLELEDRVELGRALTCLQEALADVGLDARQFHEFH